MDKRTHLDSSCPGKAYFSKKEKMDKDEIREIFQEVVGDVPRYMRMAGENRIWLFLLSALVIADTWMIGKALYLISQMTA